MSPCRTAPAQFPPDLIGIPEPALRTVFTAAQRDLVQRHESGQIALFGDLRKTQRIFPRAQQINHFSEGINIAFLPGCRPRRTESRAPARTAYAGGRHHSRIADLQNAADEQDVLRFQVAVRQTVLMQMSHSRQYGVQTPQDRTEGQTAECHSAGQRIRLITSGSRPEIVRSIRDAVKMIRRFAGIQDLQQIHML